MKNPSQHRTNVISGLTPAMADVLIKERWESSRYPIPTFGTPHPNSDLYPNHFAAWYVPSEDTGDEYFIFYLAKRENQDAYNFEFTKSDIGGAKFDAVQRTYVTLRSEFDPAVPAMPAAMPDTPAGLFAGDYVLAERKQTRSGDEMVDSRFVIDVHTYLRRTPLTQYDYDEAFGDVLPTTQTLWHGTETIGGTPVADLFADPDNAYWGLQSSPAGMAREGRQLSSDWYAITERYVVPAEFAENGRTYSTTIDFSWPAVLDSVQRDEWELRAGGTDTYVRPIYTKEAYRGPTAASITETFHATAPAVDAPVVMQPLPIEVTTPMIAINTGPTLHARKTLDVSTGNNHPIYKYTVGEWEFPATVPPAWVEFVASDELKPFRGGYLRTTITLTPPS